jgi:ABC-2 type transport system permease protein
MDSMMVMTKTFLKIFSKDRQAIFFTLFFPLVFMTIFSLASGGDEEPLEVGIVDKANSAFSAEFLETLRDDAFFNITLGEESELRDRVVAGDMIFVLVLPENFQNNGSSVELTMLVDAAQARQTSLIVPVVEQALLDVERDLRNTEPLFSLDVVDVQARSQRYIDFVIPGLLALSLMQISVAGSGYNIVEYRRKGILKRLFVTPIEPWHFIGGLVIARLVITVIQVSFLLTVAVLLLRVPIVGSLFSLGVVVLFGTVIFLSLGFFMGSIAKSQQAIMLLGNLITMPQMFLSGVFFPIDSMPELLQPIASLLPLSFVVSGVREIIVNGLSLVDQIPTMLGLVVWVGLSLLLAIKLFVWKEVAS